MVDMITVQFALFEATWATLLQAQAKAVVLFTGSKSQNGKSWCPDCEEIKPYYGNIVEQAKTNKLPLYVFEIGDRETWKDPMNKFRKNKHVLISSVPTLGLFDGGKVIRKLVEGEIKDAKQRALIYE